MNIDHEPIEVVLQDYYAGDWVDALDEVKVNHDERSVVANAGAYALGRKTDDLLIEACDGSGAIVDAGTGADGLTKAKVLEAFELLGAADVPDDGQRYAIVGWKQWSDLLNITEFADSDYVGDENLPWKGTQAKRWLGALWMPHSGLTRTGGVRNCYWYHKTAVGHAVGHEVKTDITWHGDRAAHFVNNMMSQGAGVIDATGIIRMSCLESQSYGLSIERSERDCLCQWVHALALHDHRCRRRRRYRRLLQRRRRHAASWGYDSGEHGYRRQLRLRYLQRLRQ
jgi:hypothetical protein